MLFCLIFSSKAFSCGFFWCHYIHVALHFQNFLDLFSLIKSLQYFIFYFSTILFILPRWQLPTCINSIISAHVSSHVTYALKVVFRMEGIYPALPMGVRLLKVKFRGSTEPVFTSKWCAHLLPTSSFLKHFQSVCCVPGHGSTHWEYAEQRRKRKCWW